jgi:hypothetical protein
MLYPFAGVLLYQIVGEGAKISGFVEDPDLRSSHLMTLKDRGIQDFVATIGDPILRAYDTASSGIVVDFDREFCKKLSQVLDGVRRWSLFQVENFSWDRPISSSIETLKRDRDI